MWYDVWFYAAGASVGILEASKNYPWEYNGKYKTAFSFTFTTASLTSSIAGGVFGAFRLYHESGATGIWVAVAVCIIFTAINTIILVRKHNIYKRCKKTRRIMVKSGSNFKDCLTYGDIKGLKKLLKVKRPDIKLEDDTLRAILRLRRATEEGMRTYLEKMREETPLSEDKLCAPRMEELRIIFIASLCVDKLKDLEEFIVRHLQTLAIALSGDERFKKFKFSDTLDGLELPHNEEFQEIKLGEFDYRTFDIVNPLDTRKCSVCSSFAKVEEESWSHKVPDCPCCDHFKAPKNNPADLGTEVTEP